MGDNSPLQYLDIAEQIKLFKVGDLVDPIHNYAALPLEPEPGEASRYVNGRARFMEPDGMDPEERERLRKARIKRWLVTNVRWDDSTSYLWIELVSLGGHFRGWLRDPLRRLRVSIPVDED